MDFWKIPLGTTLTIAKDGDYFKRGDKVQVIGVEPEDYEGECVVHASDGYKRDWLRVDEFEPIVVSFAGLDPQSLKLLDMLVSNFPNLSLAEAMRRINQFLSTPDSL